MKRIIFLAFLLTVACSKQNETAQGLVTLNVFSGSKKEFTFKSIEIIPLEMRDDALIGDIRQVKAYMENDEIYIANVGLPLGLYRYNLDGRYLNKVGSHGNGPQEYFSINDFIVHNDTVDVMYRSGTNSVGLIGYRKDGEYLYRREIGLQASSFEYFKEGYIFSTGYNYPISKNRLYLTNKLGEIVDSLLPNSTQTNYFVSLDCFTKKGEDICYNEGYNDTVYITDGINITPSYILDFGEFKVPEGFFYAQDRRSSLELLRNQKGYAIIRNYFESSNLTFFQVSLSKDDGSTINDLLYDKEKKELMLEEFLYEDEHYFKFPLFTIDKDGIVFIVSPYTIINDHDDFEQLPLTNPEVLDSLHEDDNPVLLVCKVN